jgi:hypothetical protein
MKPLTLPTKRKRPKAKGSHSEPTLNLTSPEFLQTLYEKVVRYYYMPTLSTSGNGRFSKDITSDRAFKAIEHCQTWHNQILYYDKQTPASMMSQMGGLVANIDKKDLEQAAWRMLTNLRQWARSNYDQKQEEFLAKEFLNAAKSGNTDRLRTLVKLCDLHYRRAFQKPSEINHYPIQWHYYVGANAYSLLSRGVEPNKKQVKEAAIQHRAVDETHAARHQAAKEKALPWGTIDLSPKINELKSSWEKNVNWTRIFRDLGLRDLPSAPTHPR